MAKQTVSGTFDVTLTPQGVPDSADGIALARMTLDKRFHGALEATSVGQMLTAAAAGSGAAAYVALERVTGTLQGRSGSFALMHSGVMTKDAQELRVTVAPGSGTGDLVGLSGTMDIRIEDKQHYYDFEYALGLAD